MIRVNYTEMDSAGGPTLRLEARGHAGYAPAGQDIVCAGASTLMQTLAYLLAGEENAHSDVWDEEDGPRLAVTAGTPRSPWVEGAFAFAKAGFALLAERYPDHVRFADLSARGEQSMVDLQLFAEGGEGAEGGAEGPALSRAQQQQAVAAGTMQPEKTERTEQAGGAEASAPEKTAGEKPKAELPQPPKLPPLPKLPPKGVSVVQSLHARWAAEEAMLRREVPGFALKEELRDPEMRRLMQLPGMRMADAYRLTHYNDALRRTARAVEQGVVERIQQ
ncbi:MAG: ribosomal-processing cysteine protease Prp, partial [Ruminococcaceae bacterium]|nr:ribosomal-processing cysteine protease Prp [Oscillospiraceae bacterium]